LNRFIEFLQPLVSQENFTLHSDQDIQIGDQWHEHIQANLNGAKAVVLFISPAFLASSYIRNSELPVILKNAADQGVRIFPILISPSVYKRAKYKYPDPKTGPEEFTLSSIQAANPPDRTLIEMTEGEQNRVLEKVADQLADLLSENPETSQKPNLSAEPAPELENLSGAAKALLSDILKDDRSDTKGVSFFLMSETQGFYVPYLWDNHVHGALQIPMIDIATQRVAADELARKGVLNQFPRSDQLQQYALRPEFL
jgi:TIR domain